MDNSLFIFSVIQIVLNTLIFYLIENQIFYYKGLKKTVAQHSIDINKLQEEYEKGMQLSESFHRETQILVTKSLESYDNKLYELEKNVVTSVETKFDRYVLKEVCQTKNH